MINSSLLPPPPWCLLHLERVPGLEVGRAEEQEHRVGQDSSCSHQEEQAGPEVLLAQEAGHDVGGVRHQAGRQVAEEAGESHESPRKVRGQVQGVVPGTNESEPCSTELQY